VALPVRKSVIILRERSHLRFPAPAQALFIATILAAQGPALLPTTGKPVSDVEAFDQTIDAIMSKYHLPGGQLSIAKDGHLVFSRGYGYADVEKKQQVYRNSLFRIGSVSKTLTTIAILKLVEAGQLHLNDKAFHILASLRPPKNATIDPRLYEITVQQLLQHEGGWSKADAMELPQSRMAAATLGEKDPADCETIIRYQMSIPLDFTPGTKSSYSNFGFCVLGRIVEEVSKMPYEDFVKSAVLKPAGVTRMGVGGTRLLQRMPDEVRYYGQPSQPLAPSVFGGEGYVPFAYGGMYLDAVKAAGGWVASTDDLIRFVTAIDGQRGPALLKQETVRLMLETPWHSNSREKGLCWTVIQRENGVDFWHTGAWKDSNAAWLVRTSNGVSLAIAFNSLPPDYAAFFHDFLPLLLDVIGSVKRWPDEDLFRALDKRVVPGRWAHGVTEPFAQHALNILIPIECYPENWTA
jgi:CubicO group peptidase (beta-lactamase class C family)